MNYLDSLEKQYNIAIDGGEFRKYVVLTVDSKKYEKHKSIIKFLS